MRAAAVATLVLALCCAVTGVAAPATGAPQPRVDIYTSASCGYCKALKLYLGARDIAYVEHNINETTETRQAFFAMGGRGTPLVVIGDTRIHGFDPARLEAALDAAREAQASLNAPSAGVD